MTITPSIIRDFLIKLSSEGKRADGRKFDEFRNIKIEVNVVNKAEGSAKVTIGNTQVISGIKIDIGEPYPDSPDSGVMTTAAELIPMASQVYNACMLPSFQAILKGSGLLLNNGGRIVIITCTLHPY